MKLIDCCYSKTCDRACDIIYFKYIGEYDGYIVIQYDKFYKRGYKNTTYQVGYDYKEVPFFMKYFKIKDSYVHGTKVNMFEMTSNILSTTLLKVNMLVNKYFNSVEEISEFIETDEFKRMIQEYNKK